MLQNNLIHAMKQKKQNKKHLQFDFSNNNSRNSWQWRRRLYYLLPEFTRASLVLISISINIHRLGPGEKVFYTGLEEHLVDMTST